MAYIGQQPTIGAYHVLDSITLSNGQSAYTMQLDGVNFSPQSVNHMLVIINGVPQPASAYSINGHTLTLSSAATTGDVLNEIRVFGDVLNIGTPSDATVTNAKTNFVSTSSAAGLQIKGDGTTDGTLQLNCSQNSHGVKIASPNHAAGQSYTLTLPSTAPSADKALITDGSGNLSFGNAGSYVKLATATASSSSEVAFDNTVFTSTYKSYMIRINDFVLSTNANFHFADSPDNGSTFSFTSYQGNHYARMGAASSGGSGGTNSNLHSFEGWVHDASGTVNTNFVELHLPYFTQTQVNKYYYAKYLHYNHNSTMYVIDFGWMSSLSTAQNYIKFMGASGNITKGAFTVYGIVE